MNLIEIAEAIIRLENEVAILKGMAGIADEAIQGLASHERVDELSIQMMEPIEEHQHCYGCGKVLREGEENHDFPMAKVHCRKCSARITGLEEKYGKE